MDRAKFENACTVLFIDVMGLNENYLLCIFMNINVASHKIMDHAKFENGCTKYSVGHPACLEEKFHCS